MAEDRVTWGELGCPKQTGSYSRNGLTVRVKNIHILVAEGDPTAVFTVVVFRPPLGPPVFTLGHRISP